MSFGRWLLVHSFTIFLVTLIILGYTFRDQLQLKPAYQQLLSIEPTLDLPPQENTQKSFKGQQHTTVDATKAEDKKSTIDTDKKQGMAKQSLSSVSTLPTIPTISTTKSSDPSQLAGLEEVDNLLFSARQAYWDKNYADAIYFYRQLIQEDRNNPDYLGELGNIYYSLNDYQNASSLYYQAAIIFIGQNQFDRARLLVAPVIAMNRDLGEKLKFKLQ